MGKTYKHVIIAKFKQGIVKLKDIPENVYNMWNRHNYDWGEFRAKKKKLIEKEYEQRTKFTK